VARLPRFLRPFEPRPALAAAVLLALTGLAAPAAARTTASDATVALAELPREAQRTHESILAGGPFPYAKDGSVFGNRERLLPRKARGWYREYTVKTPGSRDRGARRIVCGGEVPKAPEACYYTADHYASFRRIAQ
jgi:ribonuclease T1